MKKYKGLSNLSISVIVNLLKREKIFVDKIVLHVRSDLEINKITLEKLKGDLEKFDLNVTISKEYKYGEKLFMKDSFITIFEFSYCEESLKTITNYSENIFSWNQPKFPENFTLLSGGKIVFYCIAHEHYFRFINIEDGILKRISKNLSS